MNSSSDIELRPWKPELSSAWDRFVMEESANGTLFQTRRFLSYHPDGRFRDRSLLAYCGDQLICVVPTAELDGAPFSHPGTSAGGPVIHREWWGVKRLFPLLEKLHAHYGPRWGMRIGEPCLSSRSTAPLLWFFGRQLQNHPELSSVIPLDGSDPLKRLSPKRQGALRTVTQRGVEIEQGEKRDDLKQFHALLTQNLQLHNTQPLHSAEELERLAQLLGEQQQLWVARTEEGTISAGAWVIHATPHCHHTQYIARSAKAPNAAVEAVLVEAMRSAQQSGATSFSLGISTEDRGRELNTGLLSFKEELGAQLELRHLLLPSPLNEEKL